MKQLFLFIFFVILINNTLFAQQNETDALFIAQNDSSLIIDSLLEKKSDIDTIITAAASDSLFFFVNKKLMHIYGKGEVLYKQTHLKSGTIFIDFETNNIVALGEPSDSIPDKIVNTPVLIEGTEEYFGSRMTYNFKTGKGFISIAETEQEGATYRGTKIKKVDKLTYFVEDGIYTTCDEGFPHYFFFGNEMKVIQKEQVVGKWIWLTFGGVPFPIPIPFAVFPLESGRRSGILAPAFGQDPRFGRYFSRFGYFWAINDYLDLNTTGDYYTKGGFRVNSRFRYVQRYEFSGNIEGSYANLHVGEQSDPDRTEEKSWRIRWFHNQTINPTSRFDANLEFMSGNFIRATSTDFNELLKNEIISNATYFKTWEESGRSLSVNYSRRQELESGTINEVLPNLSFSQSISYPFKKKLSRDPAWYELIGYNYNSQLQNNRNKIDGQLEIRGGVRHNISINASPKIGYFNITPNINYRESWYNKRVEKFVVVSPTTGNDSLITNDVNEINFVRTFDLGVSASTKLYGIFQPNTMGISAVRHIVQPRISYNYTPNFSKPGWGYYSSYQTSNGNEVIYNKFEREIFDRPGSFESQNLSFSVDNNIEMKTTVDPTDTTSRENKIQLLNFSGGISYNFASDSLNFSPIQISFRTQVSEFLNISGSTSYSLYDITEEGRLINKYLINEGKGLARLTNLGFSLSTFISGEKLKTAFGSDKKQNEIEQEESFYNELESGYKGIYDDRDPDFSIPWDVGLNFNYNLSKPTPSTSIKYANISANINFNLTPNWKFSFTGSYDLINKDLAAPQIRISRDLHCWIMNFTWTPVGTYTGYRFEIRVKAPQLQDLKLTKQDQFYSGRGF